MPSRSIAVVTACVLAFALGPLSAAKADAPTPQYADAYSAATDLYSYYSQATGNQDWAMAIKATESGLPHAVTVATNSVAPVNVRIYAGSYLTGAGTLVASKTGSATTVTDPTQLHGLDYTYALQPVSPTSLLLKDTWYYLVVTVPFNDPVGLSSPYSNPNTGNLYVGQADQFTWTYTDQTNRLAGSVNLELDTTAPSGSFQYTTEPTGDNSWYTVFPTAHFVCSDVGFGVATCPLNITATEDGTFAPQGTVTDLVGLSTLIVGASVQVDTTPPVVAGAYSGTLGDNGWYVTQSALVPDCSDATSGIATCTGPTVDGDGSFTLTARAKDNAGNVATKDYDVKVDATAPELTATYDGTLGDNGWYTSQSTLTPECTDETSGIASCTGATVVADGSFTLTANAKDYAGNTTSKDYDVKVDSTPPQITGAFSGTLGTNDWYKTTGTFNSQCTDGGSGVADCPNVPVSTDGTFTLKPVAKDMAGNTTTGNFVVKVDATAPTVSVGGVASGATITAGNEAAVTCVSSDATSGVASCALKATPAWSTLGKHTVVATATDNAGNVTTSSAVTVYNAPVITWTGPAASKVLKAGSYVTFTFTLRNSQGALVNAPLMYLRVLPKSNHNANSQFKGWATKVATGKYSVKVFLPTSMSKTVNWKFGVKAVGRTVMRSYQVR